MGNLAGNESDDEKAKNLIMRYERQTGDSLTSPDEESYGGTYILYIYFLPFKKENLPKMCIRTSCTTSRDSLVLGRSRALMI